MLSILAFAGNTGLGGGSQAGPNAQVPTVQRDRGKHGEGIGRPIGFRIVEP